MNDSDEEEMASMLNHLWTKTEDFIISYEDLLRDLKINFKTNKFYSLVDKSNFNQLI